MRKVPRAIVLLGAQRFDPTLGDVVSALEIDGPIATITAGWQERESDDQDLHEHLGRRTVNLRLHERAEDVFRSDPELHAAHRKRQDVLRHKQDFYRIRLEHELDAADVIRARRAPPEILAEELAASIESIRELDQWHLAQCARVRDEFDHQWRPFERRAVARHRREIEQVLAGCAAIGIAGGHVASLLNRMLLFGVGGLLDGHCVFAWTAGAMALSERVVLFHDSPPQGPGAAEVLDRGLGLVRNIVPLPHPETRLRLDDRERVSLMARRFAPSACLSLPARSYVSLRDGRFDAPSAVRVLRPEGTVEDIAPDTVYDP
ncbi:MAG: hypothetical protein U0326_27340 [Polyangiales bacterium]